MRLVLAMALLILPQFAAAQTNVSGNQSGTWTAAGSPYLVTGAIVVPTGQVLTIEPGVEVNFQGHYQFTVNGNLQAIGALNDTIYFTTDTPAVGWGGIRVDSDDVSALSYCRIEYGITAGDYPDMHGGGLALIWSNAVVSHCLFADNEAVAADLGMGGAVYAIGTGSSSGPITRFSDCKFTRNHCYGEGGAIKFSADDNTVIENCEFISNDCNYGGGAISFYWAAGSKMVNCLFADNYTMFASGGAIHTLGLGNLLYFVNCTVSGNTAVTGDGGGIYLANATGYFVNCIVKNNPGMYSDELYVGLGSSADIHYSNMAMPSGSTGGNNMNVNPQFVNAGSLDFHLAELSPCIDSGTVFFAVGSDTLIDLSPGDYYGSAPDMGAYESIPATGISEGPATTIRLHQNYPNPFNMGTTIRYRLQEESHVTARVYNVMGQEIDLLVDASQAAGDRALTWDGRNSSGQRVSAGTYFLRLRSGGQERSVRMLLLH